MANFLSQKWLLPRRHFLRGLGVSLGLPMLDCMRPLCAAKAIERPRRGVFIYLPNGVNTHDYELTQAGPDYKFSRILAPLAKHRGNISPISGLHHPNAFGIAHSATQTWLTAAKHGPTDRNTISVDQLIAGVTEAKTRFPSLQISNQGQPLAVSADGYPAAHRQSGDAFKALFSEPTGGIEKQRRQLQRRESMLDLVLEDANVLAKNLSREDRGRLDQYLTAVREVEVRTKRAEEWLETPRPKIDSGTASRLSQNVYLERLGEHLRTMYDITLAFQTDMTRVVTFNTGNEGTGPAVGDRDQPRPSFTLASQWRQGSSATTHAQRRIQLPTVRLFSRPACGGARWRRAATRHDRFALRQRTLVRQQPWDDQPAARIGGRGQARFQAWQPCGFQPAGRWLQGIWRRHQVYHSPVNSGAHLAICC